MSTIAAIVSALIAALFSYATFENKKAKVEAQDAEQSHETAVANAKVVEQQTKVQAELTKVGEELNAKHEAEQQKIDEGQRNGFDNTGF